MVVGAILGIAGVMFLLFAAYRLERMMSVVPLLDILQGKPGCSYVRLLRNHFFAFCRLQYLAARTDNHKIKERVTNTRYWAEQSLRFETLSSSRAQIR